MEENNKLPNHVAIIMDGNRRWAKSKNMPSFSGHKKGVEALRNIIKYSIKIGIKHLTVYAFSTENFNREKAEVDGIMKLLLEFTNKELKRKDNSDICFKMYGDKSRLDIKLQENLNLLEEKTKENNKMTFGICINYGGREEIVNAFKDMYKDMQNEKINIDSINIDSFRNYLYTKDIPDPDLIIRTGGEQRLSNFLLYESAYSELYFIDTYWPDFDEKKLDEAIYEYEKRNRRFGK